MCCVREKLMMLVSGCLEFITFGFGFLKLKLLEFMFSGSEVKDP